MFHERLVQQLLRELYQSVRLALDSELRETWEVVLRTDVESAVLAGPQADRHPKNAPTSPLMEAVARGSAQSIHQLISSGVTVDDVAEGRGSPLILASIHGYDDIVQTLLEAGANVNLNEYTDSRTHGKAIMLHSELVKSLEDELDTGGMMYRPAHAALAAEAIGEHRRIIERLRGSRDNFSVYGNTALMYAAMKGHKSVVKALLRAGADVNAVGTDGLSAACYAAIFRRVDILKQLILAGATTAGIPTLFHVLPCLPGGLCWTFSFLLGRDGATCRRVSLLDTIRNRHSRQAVKSMQATLNQNITKLLPPQHHWPSVSRVLRAIQCVRLFRRMVRCTPAPSLQGGNTVSYAAQLKEFLLMDESSNQNSALITRFRDSKVPGEISVLVRQAYLDQILVRILRVCYGLKAESAHILIEIADKPGNGVTEGLSLLDIDNLRQFR